MGSIGMNRFWRGTLEVELSIALLLGVLHCGVIIEIKSITMFVAGTGLCAKITSYLYCIAIRDSLYILSAVLQTSPASAYHGEKLVTLFFFCQIAIFPRKPQFSASVSAQQMLGHCVPFNCRTVRGFELNSGFLWTSCPSAGFWNAPFSIWYL